jgi:tetratricopeptide (TPR) repeat protein
VDANTERGLGRPGKRGLDESIADLNKAIQLNPNYVEAYNNRGNVKRAQGNLDGAITDYNQASQLDPNDPRPYQNRGFVKGLKGDFEGAIADYDRAIQLDPKNSIVYAIRALANASKGNVEGAIGDYTQALELDQNLAESYFNRGFARQLLGDYEGALSDFLRYDELAPDGRTRDYPELYVWLIRVRLGQTVAANQELSAYLDKRWDMSPADWISKIGEFLLDKIGEADLFAAAGSTDPKKERTQHCEAWYYSGMKYLLAGNKKTAADYFARCSATQDPSSDAYILAESELKAVRVQE